MVDTDALEDAEFLVRSTHRIHLLEAIAAESRTRDELQELTGVSRVTLGRSLGEMEDREWIERVDHHYELRPLGAIALDGISTCLDAMAAQRQLRDLVEFLPTDEMDLDLRSFGDATITRADRTDTAAPARRYAALMAAADRIRKCSYAVEPAVARAFWEQSIPPEQDIEAVLTPEALETALDVQADLGPEGEDPRETLLEYETVFVHEDTISYNLLIADDTVALLLSDDQGNLPALIESTNEVVSAWANEVFDRYRREATQVTTEWPLSVRSE